MSKSKVVVRSYKSSRGPRPKQLPVAVSSLRWALVRRLLLAVPVGLFLGGMLTTALNLETADPSGDAGMLAGLALSFALFLTVLWLLGRSRRKSFVASGGDPQAAGVLLFGVLTPRRRSSTANGQGYGGDGGYSSGGDSSGDCGGGDGGGGCD